MAVVADVCCVDAAVVLGDSALELLPELLHGVTVVLLVGGGSGSSRVGYCGRGGSAGGAVVGGSDHFDGVERFKQVSRG